MDVRLIEACVMFVDAHVDYPFTPHAFVTGNQMSRTPRDIHEHAGKVHSSPSPAYQKPGDRLA